MRIENEKSVLGAIMLEPSCLDEVREILSPEDFANEQLRGIMHTAIAMHEKGIKPDLVTLTTALKRDGRPAQQNLLMELLDYTPTAANVAHYARQVKELATLARLEVAAREIIKRANDGAKSSDLLEFAEQQVMAVRTQPKGGPQKATAALREVVAELEWASEHPGELPGLPTGYGQLDTMLGGLMPGDLVILAARPSVGKTALAGNMIENMTIKGGTPGLFFSLEMASKQVVKRLACSLGNVDAGVARIGKLTRADFSRMTSAAAQIHTSNLWIDDTAALAVAEMRARARRLHRQYGIKYVVVDYLGLMTGPGENRVQQVGNCSKGLKAMAKELDVPVIALAQLNRQIESRSEKRPVLSDLRDSGDIEQDADVVLFLHREKKAPTEDAELIIAKQRNGPLGWCPLLFRGAQTRFEAREDRREY